MTATFTLAELALESFGEHVCRQYFILSHSVMGSSRNEKCMALEIQRIKNICKQINDFILKFVPSPLADHVSNSLLCQLNQYEHRGKYCSISHPAVIAYQEFVKSVIHPAVTELVPFPVVNLPHLFPSAYFRNTTCVNVLFKIVHSFNRLKVLNLQLLDKGDIYQRVNFPAQLESFSGECDDRTLAILLTQCKLLKYLNIFSSINVTDASIGMIMKLDYLENLNIARTGISWYSVMYLLDELGARSGSVLKFLAVSAHDEDSIAELAGIFEPLDLKICLFDLHIFGREVLFPIDFRNLVGLSIKATPTNLNTILEGIGSQLVYLAISILGKIEFNGEVSEFVQIGRYCNSLTWLRISLRGIGLQQLMYTSETQLPGFEKVTTLELFVEDIELKMDRNSKPLFDFIVFYVSQCVNVRSLSLPVDKCHFVKMDLISHVLESVDLKHVEEIRFEICCQNCLSNFSVSGYSEYDKEDDSGIMRLLIDNCAELKIVNGFKVCRTALASYFLREALQSVPRPHSPFLFHQLQACRTP